MNIETELALDLAREKAKNGEIIPVIKYADEESFSRLRPVDSRTFQQHCDLVEEAICELKKAGFNARVVEIDVKEYRRWLKDELNTEMERAKFIGLQIAKNGGEK